MRRTPAAEVEGRLVLSRLVLAPVTLALIRGLVPADFYSAAGPLLRQVRPDDPRLLSESGYRAAKATAAAATMVWGLTGSRAAGAAASVALAAAGSANAGFHPPSWPFVSHVHAQLALLSLVDTGSRYALRGRSPAAPDDATARAVLAMSRLVTASVYSQAGASKLVHGGSRWLTGGSTLTGSLAASGTPLGRRISRSRRLATALGAASVGFELLFGPALAVSGRHRPAVAATAVGFHAATYATLDIAFWHLWLQLFPQYLLPAPVPR